MAESIIKKDMSEVYSTSEMIVGTWIDGKPIYRRSFSSGMTNDKVLIENVDKLVNAYGMAYIGNSYRAIPYYEYFNNNQYAATVYKNASNQICTYLYSAGSSATTVVNITLEYTKTS